MKTVALRVAHLLGVMFGISVLTFLLLRLLPGDPAAVMAAQGGTVDRAQLAEIRKELGLDLPIYQQYLHWITAVLHGDLGRSYRNNQPISTAIAQHLPVTVQLIVMAQIVSVAIAVLLALYVAPRRDRWADRTVAAIAFVLQAVPNYVWAMVGVSVFAVSLGWFPALGYVPLSEGFWASTRSLVIPTAALSALLIAVYIRVLRESVIDTLRQDYILVGKSLGYSRRQVLWRLALKPSLPPFVTVVGLHFGVLLGGAVVVEVICGLPGLGTLLLTSITNRDYMAVQGLVLLFAVVFVVLNFLTDMINLILDPRVRAAS